MQHCQPGRPVALKLEAQQPVRQVPGGRLIGVQRVGAQVGGQSPDALYFQRGGGGNHRQDLFRYMDIAQFIRPGNILLALAHENHAPCCSSSIIPQNERITMTF